MVWRDTTNVWFIHSVHWEWVSVILINPLAAEYTCWSGADWQGWTVPDSPPVSASWPSTWRPHTEQTWSAFPFLGTNRAFYSKLPLLDIPSSALITNVTHHYVPESDSSVSNPLCWVSEKRKILKIAPHRCSMAPHQSSIYRLVQDVFTLILEFVSFQTRTVAFLIPLSDAGNLGSQPRSRNSSPI